MRDLFIEQNDNLLFYPEKYYCQAGFNTHVWLFVYVFMTNSMLGYKVEILWELSVNSSDWKKLAYRYLCLKCFFFLDYADNWFLFTSIFTWFSANCRKHCLYITPFFPIFKLKKKRFEFYNGMNVILSYRLKNTITSDLESGSTLKGQITINQLIGLIYHSEYRSVLYFKM